MFVRDSALFIIHILFFLMLFHLHNLRNCIRVKHHFLFYFLKLNPIHENNKNDIA